MQHHDRLLLDGIMTFGLEQEVKFGLVVICVLHLHIFSVLNNHPEGTKCS